MGDLVLGPVVFRGFEVPERIRFGGKQRLVVHALPGGGRVVDAMGDEDAPVVWSGVFSGPDAADRARMLERLRRAGAPLALSWGAWRYTVVLESFVAEGRNPAWIPYRLTACVVSAAEAVAPADDAFVFTLADVAALAGGVMDAAGLGAAIGAASVVLAGDDVGQAIGAAGDLARLVTARAYLAAYGGAMP